ncbi:MAG: chromate transporter [Clostridiaceae bacterium]|nr:chromate transporter [Clostridiaceae bacterium]
MDLFITFLKIGTFTVGGGPSMIPLIERDAVYNKKWISKEEFVDMIALAQSIPGPIAVDASVFIGYRVAGIAGSVAAVLGSVFSAFVLLLVIAIYFVGITKNQNVEAIFKGIRPAVVALLAVPVLRMGKSSKLNKKTVIIPIITVILVAFFNVNAVYIIIAAAMGGLIYGLVIRKGR